MKLIILVVAALVAVTIAAPPSDQRVVQIVRSDFEQQPNGAYNFAVETDDGTSKQEEGQIKTVNDEENKPHEVVVVRGSYSYVDSEGKTHSVTYTADENGFQPISDDIPTVQ